MIILDRKDGKRRLIHRSYITNQKSHGKVELVNRHRLTSRWRWRHRGYKTTAIWNWWVDKTRNRIKWGRGWADSTINGSWNYEGRSRWGSWWWWINLTKIQRGIAGGVVKWRRKKRWGFGRNDGWYDLI